MLANLPAQAGRFLVHARRFYADVSRLLRRGYSATSRFLKRATLAALERIEAVLLSPTGRERVHASATFALILLFAVTSIDVLITGGPEFGAPARAAQPQRVLRAVVETAPVEVAAAPEESAEEPRPTALSSALTESHDANVIAVSQNFQPATAQTQAPVAATAGVVETSLPTGDLPAEAAEAETPDRAEPALPRKEVRVKGRPTLVETNDL